MGGGAGRVFRYMQAAGMIGVEPMSIYHYASGREEIVDGIVDLVVQQIELPPVVADWKAAIIWSSDSTSRFSGPIQRVCSGKLLWPGESLEQKI